MSRSRAGAVAGKTMVTATVAPAGDARALLWMNLAAVALVLLSAFAVIYSTHACRQLYAQLQVLESSQWGLQEDYGRLLLEESAWASHHRVEKVARAELQMIEPDLARYKVGDP